MKIILALFLITGSVSAQTKHIDSFLFENQRIEYSTYYSNDKIYGINDFYVFVNQDERVQNCLKNKHTRPYFIKCRLLSLKKNKMNYS